MKTKGFGTEIASNEFAKEVKGEVIFRPLPDYMRMIPYWIVEWKEEANDR